MTEDEDYALDLVYAHQQARAAELAAALSNKAEWDAFVQAFVKQAKETGKELAIEAIPFLAAALKLALHAA